MLHSDDQHGQPCILSQSCLRFRKKAAMANKRFSQHRGVGASVLCKAFVHEYFGDNLFQQRTIAGGDIEAAARIAEITDSREHRTSRQSGSPMECRGVLSINPLVIHVLMNRMHDVTRAGIDQDHPVVRVRRAAMRAAERSRRLRAAQRLYEWFQQFESDADTVDQKQWRRIAPAWSARNVQKLSVNVQADYTFRLGNGPIGWVLNPPGSAEQRRHYSSGSVVNSNG
jgi:hypothetical protein